MKETLAQIVAECGKRNIPVKAVPAGGNRIAYEVSGFSKSGKALIYIQKGKVICETIHQNIEEIDSFYELALVALEWYMAFMEKEPFKEPESYWAEYWVEKGIMNKQTKITYSYSIR
jgi:hypothetical protein